MSQKGKAKTDQTTRIAVVEKDRCRPEKCGLMCKLSCPVNKLQKKCIVVEKKAKIAEIDETMCIGCNICTKKCPFEAISIINLPSSLDSLVSFRYDANSFKLHRLPSPRPGQVLGLVGENGTGKSTALQILQNNLQPNFGDFTVKLETDDIIKKYRGTDLQTYFTKLYKGEMKVGLKIQYVDQLAKSDKAEETVGDMLRKYKKKNEAKYTKLMKQLELDTLLDRQLNQLSGGELQRFALIYCAIKENDVYLIDEPSSYLDVRQRLTAAEMIRELVSEGSEKYCIVVEHDLAVLDYLSDYISLLYGQPGAYGIITFPYGCREGINHFLEGKIPTENVRFRDEPIKFHVQHTENDQQQAEEKKQQKQNAPKTTKKQQKEDSEEAEDIKPVMLNGYPNLSLRLGDFVLHVKEGRFYSHQITLILGENGTGKSTFIKTIAGARGYDPVFDNPDDKIPTLAISYKPQTLTPNYEGSVQDMLNDKIPETFTNKGFQDQVVNPLNIKHLLEREVKHLSGGELQRVATILALGKKADLYLIDEPSAYLDACQRMIVAKVIRRFIRSTGTCGYIVEHDFLMSLYMADRVIVFEGKPGVECTANVPQSVSSGMNKFLSFIGVTFRKEGSLTGGSGRPRVNKPGSAKDKDQKITGLYFADFDGTEE
uniref:RNase L inhibitor n=1 Tax=Trepomonas sp. PC1 TaxID=1076344 RepID=A0A146KE93_9EUKA|eukprot:JAP94807.1 RNase L inhibitor [Trepomonas sp. PC1]